MSPIGTAPKKQSLRPISVVVLVAGVAAIVFLATAIGWWTLAVLWLAFCLYVGGRMGLANDRQRRAIERATYLPDPSGSQSVQVREYRSIGQFEADARRRMAVGWHIQGQSSEPGGISLPGTIAKGIVYHPWAVISPSKKNSKVIVTWVRGGT